jgi:hypothetical protein
MFDLLGLGTADWFAMLPELPISVKGSLLVG